MRKKLLEQISDPAHLRELKVSDLNILAEEMREEIVGTVCRTGGHLASSLGVVELTLALHYVFQTPLDLLVWDVGHQCYAHKILTGRRQAFSTLRTLNGLSGFPLPQESPYDAFGVGHSSTSISAGLGMAEALSHLGEARKVVAIIGDGSMTAGMAFEALNHAGFMDSNIIVVLNDNEMSISANVGALSGYLNRILTGQLYTRFREEMKTFLRRLPGLGESVSGFAKKWEEYAKGLLTPGILFEELGFQYVGPLDGHRLGGLVETLRNISQLSGPILLHVITKKGCGFQLAEDAPTRYHGVGCFDPATGEGLPKGGPPSFTSVFGRTLAALAERDERIVAITAAMPQGTGLETFAGANPRRFYDVGIAEQHGVTFAAGLAAQGMKPVVAIYSTFLQRGYDQVIHDVCLQDLPVVFAVDRGGIVGEDGPTHHGLFDLSYLRPLPNLILMAPKDERELQQMMVTALESRHPCALRYPRGEGIGVDLWPDAEIPALEIGQSEILKEGRDLVILAAGHSVYPSLTAVEQLENHGVSAAVVNARFIKPLDEDTIAALLAQTKRVVTVEENVLAGGFGSAVLELIADRLDDAGVRVLRVGIPDVFVPHGSQRLLRARYGLDADGLFQRIMDWLSEKQQICAASSRSQGAMA